MGEEQITRATQENILCLLTYNEDYFKFIRNVVDVKYFESFYKDIAKKVYTFIDNYDQPPKDHIFDLFEDELDAGNEKAKILKDTLIFIHDTVNEDGINVKYTIDSLRNFVRRQQLKSAILNAAEVIQKEGENNLIEAETILNKEISKRNELFDPGITPLDFKNSLCFLNEDESVYFTTGIKELDHKRVCPLRGGLSLFVGPPNSGKTTYLINLAKHNVLQAQKVLYISLEMSEAEIMEKFFSSMFAIPKYKNPEEISELKFDSLGRFTDLDLVEVIPDLYYDDPEIEKKIKDKSIKFGSRLKNLIVKRFPNNGLSIQQLNAYLDNLEQYGFIPDLVVVDYVDIMGVGNINNYRLALGRLYEDLRGVAVERNIAIASASQSNRESKNKKIIKETELAEDWSKAGTVDNIITYSQTDQEHDLGLARLYVAKSRKSNVGDIILISQRYSTGSFCLQSASFNSRYNEILDT